MRLLNAYLDQVRATPFIWGVHDCLIFTNTAWHKMHARGWADDCLGRYMVGGAPKPRDLLDALGHPTFDAAISARLRKVDHVPPRGALVRWPDRDTAVALGISLGTSAAFLGPEGLEFRPIERVSAAWIEP